MWLELLLFGARFDTGFSVKYEVQVSLESMKFSLFRHIRRPQPESGEVLRNISSKVKEGK